MIVLLILKKSLFHGVWMKAALRSTIQEQPYFHELAQHRLTALHIGTEGTLAAVHGLNPLFTATGTVSGEQFGIHIRPLLPAHPCRLVLSFGALSWLRSELPAKHACV